MALRVEVILRQIFAYLPTEELLFTCSLVNKVWNTEARKFVRDYRVCRIRRKRGHSRSARSLLQCQQREAGWEVSVPGLLTEYNRICEVIVESGRVIPFNYMVLPEHLYGHCGNTCISDKIVLKNVIGGFKLKYLEIGVGVNLHCACRNLIVNVLREKSCDVKTLKISSGDYVLQSLRNWGWLPAFPLLEELDIGRVGIFATPTEADKRMLGWLLKDASHVKSVRVGSCLESLGILPDEMITRVKLNGVLNIAARSTREFNLLRRSVCAAELGLDVIRICKPMLYFFDDWSPFDGNRLLQYNSAIEQIIQMSYKCVRKIVISSDFNLGGVSHPPLRRLSSFHVEVNGERSVWNVIVGIDYQSKMPVLKKVKLRVCTNYEPQCGDVLHPAITVRILKLYSGYTTSTIWPLSVLFPNISVLHFRMMVNDNLVRDVFQHWCHLVELNLWMDWEGMPKRNYDSEFCGISEEEAEMLRHQDTVYLLNVHIVPIRPCLVTMLSK